MQRQRGINNIAHKEESDPLDPQLLSHHWVSKVISNHYIVWFIQ